MLIPSRKSIIWAVAQPPSLYLPWNNKILPALNWKLQWDDSTAEIQLCLFVAIHFSCCACMPKNIFHRLYNNLSSGIHVFFGIFRSRHIAIAFINFIFHHSFLLSLLCVWMCIYGRLLPVFRFKSQAVFIRIISKYE